jgi:hypothetical protein
MYEHLRGIGLFPLPVRTPTMSALGQERTFAVTIFMSALPPKADIHHIGQLIDAGSALTQSTCLRKKFSITVAKKGGHSCIG